MQEKINVKSEDKCEVSEDKHEDREKMKYFREATNSTEGRKTKSKTASWRGYKDVEVGGTKGRRFSIQSNTWHLEQFRHTFRFCYRAATQLGFQVIRC